MRRIVKEHPQILFTIKHKYYAVNLMDKTHSDILNSLLCWSLSLQCDRQRCRKKFKIDCHCDIDEFPKYTYFMLMAIIRSENAENDEDKNMLRIIKQHRGNSVENVARDLCKILPEELHKNNYFETYKEYLINWLQFDLYNFACSYCGATNNTIMINRIYNYVTTLHHCRLCGIKQRRLDSDKIQHEIRNSDDNKSVNWFCALLYRKKELRDNIRIGVLRDALLRAKYTPKISARALYSEDKLIATLKDVFISSEQFEIFHDLIYYCHRFWDDIDDWIELRINICVNYYFYVFKEEFIGIEELMHEAGIGAYDQTIFEDCFFRALYQTTNLKDSNKLRNILFPHENKLCVKNRMLNIFKRLTPSITEFATKILNKFEQQISSNKIELMECLTKYKIDEKVFQLLKKSEFMGAITEKEMMVDDDNELPVYQFGSTVEYWNKKDPNFVESKYNNLKEEVLHNKIHALSSYEYIAFTEKIDNLHESMKNIFAANRTSWCKRTNIEPGTKLSKEHLLSIVLFTDTNAFATAVRGKLIRCENPRKMIETQREVAHFLKKLKETVVLYGDLLKRGENVYIGIDRKMVFNELQAHFYLPRSTTANEQVARGFAGDGGVVLKLTNIYDIPEPYFSVGIISGHNEQERLFFGASLAIVDIRFEDESHLFQSQSIHSEYVRAIRLFQSIVNGRLILNDNNKDVIDIETVKKMKEFISAKLQKKRKTRNRHLYLYQLFNHCYKYVMENRQICLNMDEIDQHIKDNDLKQKIMKITEKYKHEKYKHTAKTFKWKINEEQLSLFQDNNDLKSSEYELQDGKATFYMKMTCDDNKESFNFIICADTQQNNWNKTLKSIEISIDLYCDEIKAHSVCAEIPLTEDKPTFNVTAFLKKYNAQLCPLKKLDEHSEITWKMACQYHLELYEEEEEKEEEEDEEKEISSCEEICQIIKESVNELKSRYP
eukprot:519577_1